MELIDKILLEWSYRCEKGYPDLNNKEDLKSDDKEQSSALGSIGLKPKIVH